MNKVYNGTKSIKEAHDAGLIRLTHWLTKADLSWLISECVRINKNPKRKAMLVNSGIIMPRLAIYVNDVRDWGFNQL